MTITPHIKRDIQWWLTNIDHITRNITPRPVDKVIYTDASREGWGAYDGTLRTKGHWTTTEWDMSNINVLELKAVHFALLSLCSHDRGLHIKIMIDNTTAIAYINHMGGSKSHLCQQITRDIWSWAETNDIWLTATHIPGVENTIADEDSRNFNDTAEWSITQKIFRRIAQIYGMPDIDLFANRLNYKVKPYISWHPDPHCLTTNAFTIPWDYNLIYCFPPFSLIWKTLAKIRREKVDAILIVPQWPTQSWYPSAMRLLVDHPRIFTSAPTHLQLPHNPTLVHPLYPKMKMMALLLSGKPSKTTAFRQRQKESYFHPGIPAQNIDIIPHLRDGRNFVIQGIKTHCKPL